jgi:hypothetical protein
MTAEAAAVSPTDAPLQTAANVLQTAAGAARHGAADASAKVREVLPKVSEFVSKGAYNGSYYLAYGVVFPTLFLCHIIPGGTSFATGIVDGVAAANDYVRKVRSQPARAQSPAVSSATAT